MDDGDEQPLTGGWVTGGVARVGDTVRRPTGPHSPFVHRLLLHLERVGFDGAPRFLGIDDRGREILSFVRGEPKLGTSHLSDHALRSAARLLRRFHDAAAGVVHGDPGPWNMLWRDDDAIALIDFDEAREGDPVEDVGYLAWKALRLIPEGPPVDEQRRRLRVLADAYGIAVDDTLLDAVEEAVARVAAKGVAGRWPRSVLQRIDVERSWIVLVRRDLLSAG